jgi:hypothetical protein
MPTNDALLDTTRLNDMAFVVRRVAGELAVRLESLAAGMGDDLARILKEGDGLLGLKKFGTWQPSVRGTYEFIQVFRTGARKDPQKAPFGESWRQASRSVLDGLATLGNTSFDPTLGKTFRDGFAAGELADLLDRWAARKPEDTYGLGWQLVVKLRNHKQDLEALFAKSPRYQEFLRHTLDAITEVVAQELEGTPGEGGSG